MPEDEHPAVIVTGSAGLIGAPVARTLAERGYEVFGLDMVELPESTASHPRVHSIKLDLTEDAKVQEAIDQVREQVGTKLASVVHLAAFYDFSGEDSPMYEKVTVKGTERLLQALKEFQLEQFVFTSTMLVHEPCGVGEHIDEQSPISAKWPYPESKVDTERLIRDGYSAVPSVILRISGVYTDWGTQPTVVQQIKRIYEKDFQSHFFPGDTSAGQSGIYIDDAVDAIVRTVERRDQIEPKTPILVGEADPPSYEELQNKIGQQIHGKEWSTMYVPPAVAKVGAGVQDKMSGGEAFIKPFMISLADDHYALDISRAKELLGWEPRHHMLDEVPKMVQSLLDDPDGWYEKNGLKKSD